MNVHDLAKVCKTYNTVGLAGAADARRQRPQDRLEVASVGDLAKIKDKEKARPSTAEILALVSLLRSNRRNHRARGQAGGTAAKYGDIKKKRITDFDLNVKLISQLYQTEGYLTKRYG